MSVEPQNKALPPALRKSKHDPGSRLDTHPREHLYWVHMAKIMMSGRHDSRYSVDQDAMVWKIPIHSEPPPQPPPSPPLWGLLNNMIRVGHPPVLIGDVAQHAKVVNKAAGEWPSLLSCLSDDELRLRNPLEVHLAESGSTVRSVCVWDLRRPDRSRRRTCLCMKSAIMSSVQGLRWGGTCLGSEALNFQLRIDDLRVAR